MSQDYTKQRAITMTAAADLSAAIYHVVGISDGSGKVNISSLNTYGSMLGVLQNAPAADGRHASVALDGPSKVVIGAAVNSTGLKLTCNGSGRAVVAASGQMVFGTALSTGSTDGQVIDAYLFPPVRLSGAV